MKTLEAVLKHKAVAAATVVVCAVLVAVGVFASVVAIDNTEKRVSESNNLTHTVAETIITGEDQAGVMSLIGQVLASYGTEAEAYTQGLIALENERNSRTNKRNDIIQESVLQVETESLNLLTASKIVIGSIKDQMGQLIEEASYEPVIEYQSPFTAYSDEDYDALLRIVEAEATSEDTIGKIMVANVVINRVNSNGFPSTLYDVIHQQTEGGVYQFSPIKDGRYFTVSITESTIDAVGRALSGEDYSNGALFFVARSLASDNAVSWFDRNLEKVAEYGVHEFYAYPSE